MLLDVNVLRGITKHRTGHSRLDIGKAKEKIKIRVLRISNYQKGYQNKKAEERRNIEG